MSRQQAAHGGAPEARSGGGQPPEQTRLPAPQVPVPALPPRAGGVVGRLLYRLRHRLLPTPFPRLRARLHELADLDQLCLAMGWSVQPNLDGFPHLDAYEDLVDANQRRRRDAEMVAAALGNECRSRALEIGTGLGLMTAVMAVNAPQAEIVTLNVPPEAGAAAGQRVTMLPERERIGEAWRARGLANVRQVLADSRTWAPDCAPVDVVFIDGCHDRAAVVADTRLALSVLRPGGIVAWHDCAPALAHRHEWIDQVCLALEELCRRRLISGPLLQLRDAWTVLYRKP